MRYNMISGSKKMGSEKFFFSRGLRFWNYFWLSFLVPFALNLQQFGTTICHFAWYLLRFGMVTLHFAWYLLYTFWHGYFLHLAMFAFHFAWYLSHFGTSTSHLHGICYILVLQTFMWISWEFMVSLEFHLGIQKRVSYQDFQTFMWVSLCI